MPRLKAQPRYKSLSLSLSLSLLLKKENSIPSGQVKLVSLARTPRVLSSRLAIGGESTSTSLVSDHLLDWSPLLVQLRVI